MRILVTGSAGHLGEALMRVLESSSHQAIGLDIKSSAFTHCVGSIVNRDFVRDCVRNVDAILHAATLHKPHIATHSRQDFVDVNITGTLNLLEESAAAGIKSFVFTSSTSVFGLALTPPAGAPAAWITEDVMPVPKNIYGITKLAAENLCQLFQRKTSLPCVVLRTARFFPEDDDDESARLAYAGDNLKVNEFLYRRAELEDVCSAHLLAAEQAPRIGFGRYIISATTPFTREDMHDLRQDARAVLARRAPGYEQVYAERGWSMPASIDRVYDNQLARIELGWRPLYDFDQVIQRLRVSNDFCSSLAQAVGSKGYHAESFSGIPYPTE
jgi:UDP-glucose 4-epimerase